VEAFASGCDVTLHRRMGDETLAPLMADPPAISGGRRILIEAAFMEVGEAPDVGDWIRLFAGRIDDPQWGGKENNLSFSCRSSIAALLHDRWLESTHIGEYGGAQETVIQNLMDAVLGEDAPTLVVIGDPDTLIPTYTQRRQSLADAIQAVAAVNGWVCRERWDDSEGDYRLVLYEPNRDQEEPDWTWTTDDFVEHPDVRLQTLGVRTVVEIEWQDGLFGVAEDPAAIALEGVGRKVLYIDASDDQLITSQAQAQALAELILRDVSTALVGQSTTHGLWWRVQLGDLYAYPGDGEWAADARSLAVTGYEHTWSSDPATPNATRLDLRGQPSGGAGRWYVRDRRTRDRNNLLPEEDLPPITPVTPTDGVWLFTNPASEAGYVDEGARDTSLGGYLSTTPVTVARNGLFRAITPQEMADGITLYRIVGWAYFGDATAEGLRVFWEGPASGGGVTYSLALDPAGVVDHDDASTQFGETADEEIAPTPLSGSYTYTSPEAVTEGQVIGTVENGDAVAVVVRLAVAPDSEGLDTIPELCINVCPPTDGVAES
jgi:hypothetical protein